MRETARIMTLDPQARLAVLLATTRLKGLRRDQRTKPLVVSNEAGVSNAVKN